MPPYVISKDSASKKIHNLAHESQACHIDLILPKNREDVDSVSGLGVWRAKGYTNCHWCMSP
jgi:hypothetical protein